MLNFRDLDAEVMDEMLVAWLLSVFEVRKEL